MLPSYISSWPLTVAIALTTLALIFEGASGLANCPPGCQCDDNTLIVQCGEGQLDVLPIALNPAIQRLVIRSNKIKTIDSSIQFYAELTFLDLSSNHLMTIPQRTFAYQKKLQELHLNHNKIGHVSNKTFIGLVSLMVLNLRGNLISELHQGTFSPLIKVEELNLGENRINFLDPRAFDNLSQLRVLYLDDNALTAVPDPVTFQSLPNLAELFLGMNTLQTVPTASFQNLKGLTRLDLKSAGLRDISHDSFHGLENLRILDLSDNRLSRIPTMGLRHLVRLEELTLGQNDFEIITEGAFVGLKQLKRLDISGGLRLKRVMNNAFASNDNLEYLRISSNKMLSEVQEGALSGLPHLRHVILKANGLTTLAEGLFPWQDLITIDLSENPISCDCRLMWFRSLQITKNASNDSIADVVCMIPERLLGESLKNLNPTLLGCSHTDPRRQALIGALLVGSAATLTALALVLYRCRRKIRDYLKGGIWGSSALGRKEREYQKTFCDEDYMTRHHHPCSLGIHSTLANTYTPHHPNHSHYGLCPMPIVELNNGDVQKNFQQLQVPTTAKLMMNEKKSNAGSLKLDVVGPATILSGPPGDDSASFVMHMKAGKGANSNCSAVQKLNHYTKPQFLQSTATVGDSCYSYADVPMVHATTMEERRHAHHHHQVRLNHDHFSHYNDVGSDIVDANYIYGNTHYSMPLEQTGAGGRSSSSDKTTTITAQVPPALPIRNGIAATIGRRSFHSQSSMTGAKQHQHQQTTSNTMRHFH